MNSDAFKYAPYYCEENIWHLCQESAFRNFERKAVFLSNAGRTCALWNQRARAADGEPVLWDYHVVMMFNDRGWQVYDLDTLLGAPVPLNDYLISTFGEAQLPEQFQPMFRVIDAEEFVSFFSSDRSHMRTADGQWQVPPPAWPAVVRGVRSNLMDFVDMQMKTYGMVFDLTEFQIFFS